MTTFSSPTTVWEQTGSVPFKSAKPVVRMVSIYCAHSLVSEQDLTNAGYVIVIGVPLFILVLCVIGCVYACCFKKDTSDPVYVVYSPGPGNAAPSATPLLSPSNASVNPGYGTQ